VATKPVPNPNEKLLKVFDSEQEAEAMVVKGLLESEGIECEIRGIDLTQDVMPIGGSVVLVREEDAPRALQIIEEYRRTPEQELEDENAAEVTGEPPAEQ
jgi:hypothetical protein